MDNFLNFSPGLIVWTLINFILFLIILGKFGFKPILQGLKLREENIANEISSAKVAREEADRTLAEVKAKLADAHTEMMNLLKDGRTRAEQITREATDAADVIKKEKIEEAAKEINRQKELALRELRSEIATLVVSATEKILEQTVDAEQHSKFINKFVDQVSQN